MNRVEEIEKLLRKHKYNKTRLAFLENQLKRLTPETHNDYIEYRMFEPGYSGKTPKFLCEGGDEVAQLNKVEETAEEYERKCKMEYDSAKAETEKEIKELRYCTAVIDDALSMLERLDNKSNIIVEGYFIKNRRMEDIANSMHISRSRCYDLCKKGLSLLARVIYGENMAV